MLRIFEILDKIKLKLLFPAPWKILGSEKIFIRQNKVKNYFEYFVEILQFSRWFFKSILDFKKFYADKNEVPFKIYFLACVLNCFKYEEVKILYQFGFNNWDKMSIFNPELQSLYIHQKNRNDCSKGYLDVVEILGNKNDLMTIVPDKYKASRFIIRNNDFKKIYPSWWADSLNSKGLVLKPIAGSKKNGVVRFLFKNGILKVDKLNGNYINPQRKFIGDSFSLDKIFKIWQQIFHGNIDALVMPYLENDNNLSEGFPSIVIRVITFKEIKKRKICAKNAWLEIFNLEKEIIFLDDNGTRLSFSRDNTKHKYIYSELNDLEEDFMDKCKKASVDIHSKLSSIDQVAWDWIPCKNGPKLLEGNAFFGLFIPQIFDRLRNYSL